MSQIQGGSTENLFHNKTVAQTMTNVIMRTAEAPAARHNLKKKILALYISMMALMEFLIFCSFIMFTILDLLEKIGQSILQL